MIVDSLNEDGHKKARGDFGDFPNLRKPDARFFSVVCSLRNTYELSASNNRDTMNTGNYLCCIRLK